MWPHFTTSYWTGSYWPEGTEITAATGAQQASGTVYSRAHSAGTLRSRAQAESTMGSRAHQSLDLARN